MLTPMHSVKQNKRHEGEEWHLCSRPFQLFDDIIVHPPARSALFSKGNKNKKNVLCYEVDQVRLLVPHSDWWYDSWVTFRFVSVFEFETVGGESTEPFHLVYSWLAPPQNRSLPYARTIMSASRRFVSLLLVCYWYLRSFNKISTRRHQPHPVSVRIPRRGYNIKLGGNKECQVLLIFRTSVVCVPAIQRRGRRRELWSRVRTYFKNYWGSRGNGMRTPCFALYLNDDLNY